MIFKAPKQVSRFRSFFVQQSIMGDCNPDTLSVNPTTSAAGAYSSPALSSTPSGPFVAPTDLQSDARSTSSSDQKQTRAMLCKRCRPFYPDFEKLKMQCLSWPTTCTPGDRNTRELRSSCQALLHETEYTSKSNVTTLPTPHDPKFCISQDIVTASQLDHFERELRSEYSLLEGLVDVQ